MLQGQVVACSDTLPEFRELKRLRHCWFRGIWCETFLSSLENTLWFFENPGIDLEVPNLISPCCYIKA